jgi:transcriptional regulator with XRE-family HTH domain
MEANLFGPVVRTQRKALHLTLEAVGKKAGTSKSYLSGIEQCKVNPPTPHFVLKLAKILSLDVNAMLLRSWVDKAPKAIKWTPMWKEVHAKTSAMATTI